MTLLEKLDALSRRYARDAVEPDGFVRHYEEAAHIIRSLHRVPVVEQSARDLADDMLREKDIAALPRGDEPALLLAHPDRSVEVVRAFERIAPMFWGDRIPLHEACATIVEWIRESLE